MHTENIKTDATGTATAVGVNGQEPRDAAAKPVSQTDGAIYGTVAKTTAARKGAAEKGQEVTVNGNATEDDTATRDGTPREGHSPRAGGMPTENGAMLPGDGAAERHKAAEQDGALEGTDDVLQDNRAQRDADATKLTAEQQRIFADILRENAALRAEQAERVRANRAKEQAISWQKQAEELKNVYPSLELKREMSNPQTGQRFQSLLKGGADLRTAYEAVHRDEILSAVMRYAAERAREMTVSDIRARGIRPAENGGDGIAATSLGRVDVHSLTRRERESIARRVLRGERVEL